MKKFGGLLVVLSMVLMAAGLTGCGRTIDVNTSGMYLVVYDGNGGYLGNKTSTMRKLFCTPGSKIPDYPVDYVDNQYTVPSLGLAMREGYQLLGWYYSATYSEAEGGEYLLLSLNDGNGVYESDANGKYVRSYVQSDDGGYIYVPVEEAPADTEAPAWVYIGAAAEGETALSKEPGFYFCNGTEMIKEIDDDALRAAYEKAYATKIYSKADVDALAGWRVAADLKSAQQELFKDLPRYNYSYAEAGEQDADLDHYSLKDDYASVFSLFIENENGKYVQNGSDFVLADDKTDAALQRFGVNEKYIFTGATTAGMKRYDAKMSYWDFANDHVTEDLCTNDGEKFVLTLTAHWEKKNTVYYHYCNGTGQVDTATRKLLPDNVNYVNLVPGDTIGKKEIIPTYKGHSFICWSKTEDAYEPWDFTADVFPEGANEMHLYAYYADGEYTRITSASGLAAIGNDPAGNYMIIGSMDLQGKEYGASPFGLKSDAAFTGKILGINAEIKNFTVKLTANKKQSLDTSMVQTACLIPLGDGAAVEGLKIDMTVSIAGLSGKGSGGLDERTPMNFRCSGLYDTVQNGASAKDCEVKITVKAAAKDSLKSDVYNYVITVGDYAAKGDVQLENCRSEIDRTELTGSVSVKEKQSAK